MQISLRNISSIIFRKPSKILKEINSNSLMDKWLLENPSPELFDTREELYEYINNSICQNAAIDYLEFGVAQGKSMKSWVRLNDSPDSKFYGFDTFEGLPESFDRIRFTDPIGEFTNNGEFPKINDKRIGFNKGLFQETLPSFLDNYFPQNRLIIHNDSDLYTSSLYLLTMLNKFIIKGSIIIFDEFFCSSHEFQAFYDYVTSYQRSYKVLGATTNGQKRYTQIAIQII